MRVITRTVWILSLVSLFADIASEMLYPVVPVYLRQIGFSVVLIGVLEGFVSFITGLSKGYFGNLSDRKGYRLPFVRLGYFLSAIAKPLLIFSVFPVWVFFTRTVDRIGKGLRTAPRDALLSAEANPATRARVFGFHRGMDSLGAAIGPLLALLFLQAYPGNYKDLFLLAGIPGIIAVIFLFAIREKNTLPPSQQRPSFFSFFKYWKLATRAYRKRIAPLLLLALFNSADVFLILKTREITGSDTLTIAVYILYNLVFAIASYPLGRLADKIGIEKVQVLGIFTFAIVYYIFAFASSLEFIIVAFTLYGLYAAATDGLIKAWISNHSLKRERATAIGFYTSSESVCMLVASIGTGLLWATAGPLIAFALSASVAVIVAVILQLQKIETITADDAG